MRLPTAHQEALPADGDLMVVRELRGLVNDAGQRAKTATATANESQKWLEWPEFLWVVAELKKECAARDSTGRLRRRSHVAWSLQRYLIFAVLACVPGLPCHTCSDGGTHSRIHRHD